MRMIDLSDHCLRNKIIFHITNHPYQRIENDSVVERKSGNHRMKGREWNEESMSIKNIPKIRVGSVNFKAT